MLTIKNSYYFSLLVQTLIVIYFIVEVKRTESQEYILLSNAIDIEFIVNIIEFIGYLIIGFYLNSKVNITAIRYVDWFVTTNMMLITLSFFLEFNNIFYENIPEAEKKKKLTKHDLNFMKENYGGTFLRMIIFNIIMLVIGFIGELGYINKYISLILGLLFFGLSFKEIIDNFMGGPVPLIINKLVFGVFIFIWLLYAVAFLLKFKEKNIAYNLLDLVSKNFFGVFLIYYLKNIQ